MTLDAHPELRCRCLSRIDTGDPESVRPSPLLMPNAATLLKLALEVEQENQRERDALRSPGLRGEIRELRESLKSLEDQVKQIREYVGFQPPQHCPDGRDRHSKPDIS